FQPLPSTFAFSLCHLLLLSAICLLPSAFAFCHLPSAFCHLLSAICFLPFAFCFHGLNHVMGPKPRRCGASRLRLATFCNRFAVCEISTTLPARNSDKMHPTTSVDHRGA